MSKETEKYSQGDLVEVRFYDIHDIDDWTNIKDVSNKNPPKCKLTAHYVNEDDKKIRLAIMIAEDEDVTYALIPKGLIISTRKIEEAELFDFEDEKE